MEQATTEQAVHFVDPFGQGRQAEVILRPLHLPTLASLLRLPENLLVRKRKMALAQMLALGKSAFEIGLLAARN